MTLKQIMKEIMSPHRAQSEESLQGLNLGMFGMLYNLYSDLYGVLTVEIRCVPSWHTCLTSGVLVLKLWIMIDVLTEYQGMAKGSPCVVPSCDNISPPPQIKSLDGLL